MNARDRHYGTDETDEFDTLAEVTVQPDGTLHYKTVQVDKPAPLHDQEA